MIYIYICFCTASERYKLCKNQEKTRPKTNIFVYLFLATDPPKIRSREDADVGSYVMEVFEVLGGHSGGVAGRQQTLHGPALPRMPVFLARHLHLAPGLPVVATLLVHARAVADRRGRFVQLDDPEQILERPGRPRPDVGAPPLLRERVVLLAVRLVRDRLGRRRLLLTAGRATAVRVTVASAAAVTGGQRRRRSAVMRVRRRRRGRNTLMLVISDGQRVRRRRRTARTRRRDNETRSSRRDGLAPVTRRRLRRGCGRDDFLMRRRTVNGWPRAPHGGH